MTYGVVNVSNLDIQPGDAFHQTQRASINLMWNPVPFVDIVVEFLAGTRINKNGQRASSSQIQSWLDAQVLTVEARGTTESERKPCPTRPGSN